MAGARTDPDETADVAPNTVGAAANVAAGAVAPKVNAGAAGAGAAGGATPNIGVGTTAAGAGAPKVNAGAAGAGAAGGLGGHLARLPPLPPRLRDAITLTRFQKLPFV